jgi:hypothetical protein
VIDVRSEVTAWERSPDGRMVKSVGQTLMVHSYKKSGMARLKVEGVGELIVEIDDLHAALKNARNCNRGF